MEFGAGVVIFVLYRSRSECRSGGKMARNTMIAMQKSAKIYQFPRRNRTVTEGARREMRAAEAVLPPSSSRIVYGGAWYHEEAVEESRRGKR